MMKSLIESNLLEHGENTFFSLEGQLPEVAWKSDM